MDIVLKNAIKLSISSRVLCRVSFWFCFVMGEISLFILALLTRCKGPRTRLNNF